MKTDGESKQAEPSFDPQRILTVEEKLTISQALYQTAKVIKIGMLRRDHPEWTEEQLVTEAQRMMFLMHD